MYTPLQLREVFHLEFLRWFGRAANAKYYALKGGVNLRFFFRSLRYSEDMDLDVQRISVAELRDRVKGILKNASFQNTLRPFGIESVRPPDISKAKQTQATQRFKIHLLTSASEDLFTKIEFSRRGLKKGVVVQTASELILRAYKLPPLVIPHYDIQAAISQKIEAVASRAIVQARDIFDLYILNSQYANLKADRRKIIAGLSEAKLSKAEEHIYEVSFRQFRDTVLAYLSAEEQPMYNMPSVWDEIKLKAVNFINEIER